MNNNTNNFNLSEEEKELIKETTRKISEILTYSSENTKRVLLYFMESVVLEQKANDLYDNYNKGVY
jgi:hypothetical protein